MRYLMIAAIVLSASCASRKTNAPAEVATDCVVTRTLDPNAVYEAGIYAPLSGPISGEPAVNLRISNVAACGQQGTDCDAPDVIGGVTVMMTLVSATCDGNFKLPEPGTYNLTAGSPPDCIMSANATYELVTAADLHPAAVPLTTGQFVIDSIAWTPEMQDDEQQVTSLSGHMDVTLPDGSHLVQHFATAQICE